jgi:hypothetical protein
MLSERGIIVRQGEPGFRKVEFTKLLQERYQLSLRDAKAKTDALLEGAPIDLAWQDGLTAKIRALHAEADETEEHRG